MAPALVILRGNSASGKSTIARKVQHDLPRGRIAVIGQAEFVKVDEATGSQAAGW